MQDQHGHYSPYPLAYNRVNNFLKDMLCAKLEHCQTMPMIEFTPVQVVENLRHQPGAFWHDEWPFNLDIKEPAWGEHFRTHFPCGQFLFFSRLLTCRSHFAVKLFSVLVNFVPDKRTNSTTTWLNSPIRGRQNSRTLVDIIQVGQW